MNKKSTRRRAGGVTIALLVALGATQALGSSPQERQVRQTQLMPALTELQSVLTTVRLEPGLQTTEQGLLDDISELAEGLSRRYRTAGQPVARDFAETLAVHSMSLRDLPRGPARQQLLKDVKDDLELKWRFVTANPALSGGFPSDVHVTVETYRGDVKIDGLWVRCNPRRYGVTKDPMFVFSSASTPTSRSLPPGAFTMWLEDDQKNVLASQPVDIGESGATETIRFVLAK